MKKTAFTSLALAAILALTGGSALAQDTKVVIGMSGWTGFAPLTLARAAGLFKKHGLDVSIKMIPRHYSMKTTPVFSELKAELTEQVRVEVRAAQAAMEAA